MSVKSLQYNLTSCTVELHYRLPPIVARARYFRFLLILDIRKIREKNESNPHSKVTRAGYLRWKTIVVPSLKL